jgi:hypothetical protein
MRYTMPRNSVYYILDDEKEYMDKIVYFFLIYTFCCLLPLDPTLPRRKIPTQPSLGEVRGRADLKRQTINSKKTAFAL